MSLVWIAWAGLAAVAAVGFAVLVRTRWLQSHTLAKCAILSLALHAALAVVCAFVSGLMPASWGRNDEGRMAMTVVLAADTEDEAGLVEAGAAAVVDRCRRRAAGSGQSGPVARRRGRDAGPGREYGRERRRCRAGAPGPGKRRCGAFG